MTVGRPPGAAPGSCRLQPGDGLHADLVALELSERGHDREKQLAAAGRLVITAERARQDAQSDAARVQVVGNGEDLLRGPAEAVQLSDGERVTLAEVIQRGRHVTFSARWRGTFSARWRRL